MSRDQWDAYRCSAARLAGLNGYIYADNNPTNRIDWNGRTSVAVDRVRPCVRLGWFLWCPFDPTRTTAEKPPTEIPTVELPEWCQRELTACWNCCQEQWLKGEIGLDQLGECSDECRDCAQKCGKNELCAGTRYGQSVLRYDCWEDPLEVI